VSMIVDTSALCAIIFGEPEQDAMLTALANSKNTAIAAPILVELQAVLEHRSPRLVLTLNRLLAMHKVQTIAFTEQHAAIARDAYRLYGKASGSKAALNICDCYSYALAIATAEPLLFVGNDFTHTDVQSAL